MAPPDLVECGKAYEEGEVLEYALGLLLNCATYTSSNVSLLNSLGGQTVLTKLQQRHTQNSSLPEQQRERVMEMNKKLLFFLSCK